jgi:hypothetical protein
MRQRNGTFIALIINILNGESIQLDKGFEIIQVKNQI